MKEERGENLANDLGILTDVFAYDFMGNKFREGDKVLSIQARNLRKSIVEKIIPSYSTHNDLPVHEIKIKGLKRTIASDQTIRMEWKK